MSPPTVEQLRRLGQSLREIDPGTLNQHAEEGPVRWFQGEGGTELTAWLGPDGVPHHLQLVFARVSVELSERGLLTGAFEDKSTTAGGRYDPYLLRVGTGADAEVCRAAQVLLEASEVDAAVRAPLQDALTRALAGEQASIPR